MSPFLSEKSGGVRLRVHAQPGAKRSEIVGLHGDALKIRIAAPPEDGRANAELVRFLARVLGVSRSAIELESGPASRTKSLLISGLTIEAASAKLNSVQTE